MADKSNWLELVRLALRPRYSFCVWVGALFVLLIPFPEFLKLQDFKNEFGKYLGVVALFFLLVWIVELFLFCSNWVFERLGIRKEYKVLKSTIEGLNPAEKYVLAKHLVKNYSTLNWPPDKSEIASLVYKGLLHRIATNSSFGTPHVVETKAWAYLLTVKNKFIDDAKKVNPEKLDLVEPNEGEGNV